MTTRRAPDPLAHRLALTTAAVTGVLLVAGGLVTSTGSGLAVPDWPLSFGTLLPPMEGGVRFEHTHRLIAGAVLLLMVALTVRVARGRAGTRVRRLAFLGMGAVLAQAGLGGLTVLLQLPPAVSIAHALLAQTFFTIICCLAAATGPALARARPSMPGLRRAAHAAAGALAVQILLGAVTRHLGAGRAFPDWPLSGGRIVPEFFGDPGRAFNFAHRTWAWIAAASVLWAAHRAWHGTRREPLARRWGLLLPALLVIQITLGAGSVLHDLPPVVTALHVLGGGLLLAGSAMLVLDAEGGVVQ